MNDENVVELQGVSKQFGSVTAVDDCSFVVKAGEFVSLLGPSGSGKTTTLRMIAGFETPTTGSIVIGGRNVDRVAPKDRNISMVFQNYALFPHLDVFENVAFGLRVRGSDKASIAPRVKEYLELVQLASYEDRVPKQLSGGQQQRVALARALITEPQVLLLDEPLGALDRKLREELQFEVKELLTRLGITAIYVTHDQDEALVMSDRVAVMSDGRIEQLDSPEQLYEHPRTRFVAMFVGTSNLFEGQVKRWADGIELDIGGVSIPLDSESLPQDATAAFVIRPEKVVVHAAAAGADGVRGRVIAARYLGALTQYRVRLSQQHSVLANVVNSGSQPIFGVGDDVHVAFPTEQLRYLEPPRELPAGADRQRVEESVA